MDEIRKFYKVIPETTLSVFLPRDAAVAPPSKLFAWGLNHYQKVPAQPDGGQLALFDTTDRSSPVQVTGGNNFDSVRGGNTQVLGIRGGKLYTWGINFLGCLGLGDTVDRSSPCQVGSLTTWKQASGGTYFSAAITTDGKLFTWGDKFAGELGLGSGLVGNYSSPMQVGADTNWASVSCGYSFCLAIKTTGKLYSWGQNNVGQLGLGDIIDRSSPVQIGSGTNWAKVIGGFNSSFGITTDGKLYSWGGNTDGQLGQGDITPRSVPAQIGSGTDWYDVSTSLGFSMVGLRGNGQLWGCGANPGTLGQNNITPFSSPVQIGADRSWAKIAVPMCDQTLLMIDTSGQLWATGTTTWGELGIGLSGVGARISSPVLVGAQTTWTDVTCSYYSVFGRRT